jgi:hypothetical protein
MVIARFAFFLVLALAVAAGGCSSFNRAWKAGRTSAATNDIQGRWSGSWQSETGGHHHGRLRCLVTQKAPGEYDARFRATYKKILSYSYTVPLKVVASGEVYRFSGEADLGSMAGGVYHYEGQASPTSFFSTYRCKFDHGTFQMQRPRPAE